LTSDPPETVRPVSGTASNSFLVRHAWLWLVPLSALVGVMLLEGVLRLFPSLLSVDAQQRLLFLTTTGGPKSIADRYLGSTDPPLTKTEMISRDWRFTVETDEHGFRNRSPWPDRAEVVVVGDSMAYGYGVAKEQAWPTLLAEALPASRVITLAEPGTVPRQYTRYFERFGVPLRPKVLLYTIFPGNDIVESPLFDQWVAAGSPGNYDVYRYFQGKVPTPGHSPLASLLDHSFVVLSLSGMRKNLLYGFSSTTVKLADGGRLQLTTNQYRSSIAENTPGNPAFDAVVRATVEARDRASAIGCHFIVLLVPEKERVYQAFLKRPYSGLTHPLQEVLEHDKGMAVINLTDPLTKRAAHGQTLYFEVDGHPNALGNRVIADVVTQYLRTNAQPLGLEDWNQANPPSDLARAR